MIGKPLSERYGVELRPLASERAVAILRERLGVDGAALVQVRARDAKMIACLFVDADEAAVRLCRLLGLELTLGDGGGRLPWGIDAARLFGVARPSHLESGSWLESTVRPRARIGKVLLVCRRSGDAVDRDERWEGGRDAGDLSVEGRRRSSATTPLHERVDDLAGTRVVDVFVDLDGGKGRRDRPLLADPQAPEESHADARWLAAFVEMPLQIGPRVLEHGAGLFAGRAVVADADDQRALSLLQAGADPFLQLLLLTHRRVAVHDDSGAREANLFDPAEVPVIPSPFSPCA